MDFLHLVLLLEGIFSLLHFALLFFLLAHESIFLALVVRLLVALFLFLYVLLCGVLSTILLRSPVLNGEFVLLLEWPMAKAPDQVPLAKDVREHVFLLLLVSPLDLLLVIVNFILDLFFLLFTFILLILAFLLVLFSSFLFLFFLLPFFFLFIELLLLLCPFLEKSGLSGSLLLLLGADIKLAVLVRIMHRLLQNVVSYRRFFDCFILVSHSFTVGRSTEAQHLFTGR